MVLHQRLMRKPHINWNWQMFCASFHNSEAHKRIKQSALCNLCYKSQQILGDTLAVLRASSMSYSPFGQCEKWSIGQQMATVSRFEIFYSQQSKRTRFQSWGIKRGATQHCLRLVPHVRSNPYALLIKSHTLSTELARHKADWTSYTHWSCMMSKFTI